MWRMTRDSQIIYLVLHDCTFFEIMIYPDRFREIRMATFDKPKKARAGALRATVAWENIDYELHVVYAHPEPNRRMVAGLLAAGSRYRMDDLEDCLEILAEVTREFYEHGRVLQ